MASQEQLRTLTPLVMEAQQYRRWHGDNDNPALGKAIVAVDNLLIRELGGEADDDIDVENLVADAGATVFAKFHKFRSTTGAELYGWVRKIVVRAIANLRRRREAQEEGRLRCRPPSAETIAEAVRLIDLVESREPSPVEEAIGREDVRRVRRALRRLTFDELRVTRLVMQDTQLREIAVSFGHSLGWVQDVWERAAHRLRMALMRRGRAPMSRPVCAA
jgi:RNA polymerase sigma factor (sigma-70 family)